MKAFVILIAVVASIATQPPSPSARQEPGRGGRGQGPRGAEPLVLDDHTGFGSIFDGATLKGWDGDPAFWRAEDGVIVGQSTDQNPLKQNTFLIWRGGEPAEFGAGYTNIRAYN